MAPPSAALKKSLVEQVQSIKEEERVNFLINKVTSLANDASKSAENQKLAATTAEKLSQLEKKLSSTEKMLSRAELAKSKLEELCRQLNKSKKEDADRNVQRLQELERSHKETVERLKSSLDDIQKNMDVRQAQAKRMEDVEEISKSLNNLSKEYETRLKDLKLLYEDKEEKIQDVLKSKDQELNLLRTEVANMRSKVEEVFQENLQLREELVKKEKDYRQAVLTEKTTKKAIDDYGEKYNELVKIFETSNQAFERARTDMAKMNGQLIKLQGESRRYRTQLEESNKTIEKLTKENCDVAKASELKDKQISQLQALCRRLQKNNGNDTPE